MVSPVPAAGMFPDMPDMRWPRLRQYCSAIFTATSTDTDPESQTNTVSSPDGAMSTSSCANRAAGSWVSPPNMT
jgi:hypothetical protein